VAAGDKPADDLSIVRALDHDDCSFERQEIEGSGSEPFRCSHHVGAHARPFEAGVASTVSVEVLKVA
jgi:hypothetical protein